MMLVHRLMANEHKRLSLFFSSQGKIECLSLNSISEAIYWLEQQCLFSSFILTPISSDVPAGAQSSCFRWQL